MWSCLQMSDFEAECQAVCNLIAQHEDFDALIREVRICLLIVFGH